MPDLQERTAQWAGVGLRDQHPVYDGDAFSDFHVLDRDDIPIESDDKRFQSSNPRVL